jgi:hypothetical protein
MSPAWKIAVMVSLLAFGATAWEQDHRTWSAPWSWQSPIPEAKLGLCVASGGDVNGDGIDDMVFAAPYDATGGIELGTIFVLFGSSAGWQPELDVTKTADASFRGEAYRDHPGGAEEGGSAGLAIVQSVNGDIYDEIVVASAGNDEAGVDHGKVYVIYGKEDGWTEIDTLSNADATYLGEAFLGETPRLVVANAGDVNGDGKGDILVGAATIGTGKVYLILGNESRPTALRSLAEADASFVGEMDASGLSRAGFSVSGVPDLNNDGRDEILIGAPKFSPDLGSLFVGKAYLILGKASGWSLNDTLSNADVSVIGENGGDEVGFTVRGVGDTDSDGKGDFLISSRFGTGHVYLFLGSSISAPASNVPITDADTHFLCADISTGDAMTPLGDVNDDTYDDFALGAPFYDAGPGKAYAVLGREIWPSELAMEETEGGWKGTSSKFWAGSSVAGGDVNDDGRPDLVIGAGADPFAGYDAGSVFVVPSNYGGDTTPPARTTDLDAGYDVSGHATLTWSQVTQDANGQPEAVLFYRVLRHKHQLIDEPETRVYSLPAVLDPETTVADTADVVGDVNFFYYYRILTIDETGNVSEQSTGTGAFDFLLEFPQD